MTLALIQSCLCTALLWSCFCRLVHTDEDTRHDVRASFWAVGVAALVCGVAPWAWDISASIETSILAGAVLLMQLVTARYWRAWVHAHFQRGGPPQADGEADVQAVPAVSGPSDRCAP